MLQDAPHVDTRICRVPTMDNDGISLRDFLRRGDSPPPSYPLSQRDPAPPPYSLSAPGSPRPPRYPISHRDPRRPSNSPPPRYSLLPGYSIPTRDALPRRISGSFLRSPSPIHLFDPRRHNDNTLDEHGHPPPIPPRNPRRNESGLSQATTNGRPSRAALHYLPAAYRT
ncbi:hypothetical protein F4776DRAFT_671715 [Hypoxylon sp. NC0597]|nr:hypothetical protein F4776DRAFT_671715 [Hypoxylon sp. NC0597]